jgi:DNA repair photolyase
LGGGVTDAYQGVETRYRLARSVLELAARHRFAVHVLTKSALVRRDLDLLAEINAKSRAILSFSIVTCDDAVRQAYEPHAAPIEARFEVLEQARALGIHTGVMAMPILPGISDSPKQLEALFSRAARAKVDFMLASGLTLRRGRQKEAFFETVARHHPERLSICQRLFDKMRKGVFRAASTVAICSAGWRWA